MSSTIAVITMTAPLFLILACLAFTVVNDPYIQRDRRRTMLLIIAACLTLIAQNLLESRLASGEPKLPWRTLTAIYGYTIRPVILILFLYIIRPKGKHRLWWVLAGANTAVYMTALFSNVCFWIDSANHYHSGPLASTCLIVSSLLLASLLYQTVRHCRRAGKREMWMPILAVLIIVASIIADYEVGFDDQPVSFLSIAVVISVLFYYLWLHLQFVREHEQALVADQRMQIMLSQIQPHFLYNTLAVIQNLCRSDPAQAEAATVKFSRYLRGNMDSLLSESIIPFQKELKHTQEYLELEKMRFRDKLEVRYDIGCTDFELPPLTLQPIAENAVRHGIRSNPDGSGTVAITTRERADCYEITVTDNGAGFDPGKTAESTERSHIGIQNVRERLSSLCGGTLTYESSGDSGTVAAIILPKKVKAK